MPRRTKGERRHGAGWQIYLRVRGHLLTAQLPLTATAAERRQEREQLRFDYLRDNPQGPPIQRGTFAQDVVTYLKTLVDRPRLQQNRTKQLAWWTARFGHRARRSLKRPELITALAELAAAPIVRGDTTCARSVSSRNHYRTALFHLYSTLDGKDAPNPLRDIPPPRADDPEPRAIPYAIIEAIFAAMSDRRYARKLDEATAAAIRAEARVKGANASAIAAAYGISETMVRKLRARRQRARRDTASRTKALLRVMAYTGLPPAQIRALTLADLDLDGAPPSVLVKGRRKGKGSRTARLPLTPQGVDAFRAFVAAEAFGPISMSAVDRVWRRAIARMCKRLEQEDATRAAGAALRVQLAGVRPYDLRHSFLTQVFLLSGNIRATQAFAMHADARMTNRYTMAAVDSHLANIVGQLGDLFGGRPAR